MIFEVKKVRRQYAEALRAVVDLHAGDCHESHVPALTAVRRLADLLQAGTLAQLRLIFRDINRRIFGTANSPTISDQHSVFRKKIRVMRTTAQEYAQDSEMAELAYVLVTVNKVFAVDPGRTTRLPDGVTRGSYAQYFHDVVMAEAGAVLPATASTDLIRETA